jgi:hypothetical protein
VRQPTENSMSAQRGDVGQEHLRGAGGVGAHQDRDTVPVLVRDLRQCLIEHGDVVGGGVAAGVARPQDRREELAGVVQPGTDRVEPEGVLERRAGLFLLAVRDHHRRIEIEHVPG